MLQKYNTVVVGVSPDPIEKLQKFRTKHQLNFTLLSDLDHKVADMYGVWGEKQSYGRTYVGINRSHFVIDEQGKVMDAQIKISPSESIKKSFEVCCPKT
jgi:thioredoxin-dependent peroxiredoxin